MRLLRLQEVEIGSNDRVYRHARLRALVVWLAGVAAAAALLIHAHTVRWLPGYLFGSFLLLFLFLFRRIVTARFHASNWLVRMTNTGLYIQYRSYLNYQMSSDVPSVVFLEFGEIASARLIKERVQTPDPAKPGCTQTQFLRYIELELSGASDTLAQALDAERAQRAPMEKHWYGSSSTEYRDYPVRMTEPGFLRIHWDVVPGTRKFLTAMRPNTLIRETVHLKEDFAHPASLGRVNALAQGKAAQ